jgi:hypothetical protein
LGTRLVADRKGTIIFGRLQMIHDQLSDPLGLGFSTKLSKRHIDLVDILSNTLYVTWQNLSSDDVDIVARIAKVRDFLLQYESLSVGLVGSGKQLFGRIMTQSDDIDAGALFFCFCFSVIIILLVVVVLT